MIRKREQGRIYQLRRRCASQRNAKDLPWIEFWRRTGLAVGSDGNLWFTQQVGQIERITLSGAITEFPLTEILNDSGPIYTGSDGNLRFTELNGNKIGRMTLAGAVTEFPLPTANAGLDECALASDGNLWCTEASVDQIARVAPDGTITELPLPTTTHPEDIVVGPDGGLWFVETYRDNGSGKIARMTLTGSLTEFPQPGFYPTGIATGPDGNLWFTENVANAVGRMTLDGMAILFMTKPATGPTGIVAGPDGAIWFIEEPIGKIVRMTL